ncbi:N-acetyllactosaminide beta-1,3-N-acetylglucosaminyltransferase 3-like [Symphorus nematophorus]
MCRVLWRAIRAGSPLLLGVLFVVVYVLHSKNNDCPDKARLAVLPTKNNSYEHSKNNSHVHSKNNSYVQTWQRCQQNLSAANIQGFQYLSEKIQNFLYYRHCRHFPMLLDVPDKCGGADESAGVFLLLVIKSPPVNHGCREVLRKTWAAEKSHKEMWIRRIFISGTVSNGLLKERWNNLLKEEQREFNDILQWDFDESLFNLTLKQILFLEWLEKNCPNAQYLLSGDDDVLVNTDNIVAFLEDFTENNRSRHLFTGNLVTNASPIRRVKSKYFIPFQLQSLNSYPPYCGGGGIIMSVDTALVIYRMSHSITIHPIDDVYIGMCLAKAGLTAVSHKGVKIFDWAVAFKDYSDPCFVKDQLVVHKYLPYHMHIMWQKIHDPNLKCGN